MLVFIGSVAFNTYLGADARPPKDVDAIATYDTALKFLMEKGCDPMYPTHEGKKLYGRDRAGIRYEIEIAWEGTTAQSLLNILEPGVAIPSLDILYTIKMSHRYLRNNPHFHKTLGDIHVMRMMGAKIFDEDWYKARMAETYWYEHPDLTRTKEEFFVDPYKYDHDSIHEAVAFLNMPAYMYYQREGAKGVSCSKKMFFEADPYVQLAGVVEESSVLALERSLIPHPGVKTEQEAFDFALEKVCTSITSGWFREFAWENYGKARKMFQGRDKSLLQLLNEGLEKGIVRPSETVPA